MPGISKEQSSKVAQTKDTISPTSIVNTESSNTSLNWFPEQRTSSGRLVKKPIRYREDVILIVTLLLVERKFSMNGGQPFSVSV